MCIVHCAHFTLFSVHLHAHLQCAQCTYQMCIVHPSHCVVWTLRWPVNGRKCGDKWCQGGKRRTRCHYHHYTFHCTNHCASHCTYHCTSLYLSLYKYITNTNTHKKKNVLPARELSDQLQRSFHLRFESIWILSNFRYSLSLCNRPSQSCLAVRFLRYETEGGLQLCFHYSLSLWHPKRIPH